jgi:hypothetical protein
MPTAQFKATLKAGKENIKHRLSTRLVLTTSFNYRRFCTYSTAFPRISLYSIADMYACKTFSLTDLRNIEYSKFRLLQCYVALRQAMYV